MLKSNSPKLALQPLELICEKAIGTGNRPMGAGEALRRVLECVASGILLPGMRMLLDGTVRSVPDLKRIFGEFVHVVLLKN